jgi:hypothetical protein
MKGDKLKIAFDFHGVIEKYPEILKPIMTSLKKDHEIIILSGPPYIQIIEELEEAGYKFGKHYDTAISVVDWIKKLGFIPMHQNKNGSWYCDDEIWWGSKARICREYGISVLVDDKIEYKEHIQDNFPLFIHLE